MSYLETRMLEGGGEDISLQVGLLYYENDDSIDELGFYNQE